MTLVILAAMPVLILVGAAIGTVSASLGKVASGGCPARLTDQAYFCMNLADNLQVYRLCGLASLPSSSVRAAEGTDSIQCEDSEHV